MTAKMRMCNEGWKASALQMGASRHRSSLHPWHDGEQWYNESPKVSKTIT